MAIEYKLTITQKEAIHLETSILKDMGLYKDNLIAAFEVLY